MNASLAEVERLKLQQPDDELKEQLDMTSLLLTNESYTSYIQ